MRKSSIYLVILLSCLIFHSEYLFASEDDQKEIETLLIEINNAVSSGDYDTFKSSLIFGGHDSNLDRNKWKSWVSDPKSRKVLLHKYPYPNRDVKFLKIKKEGDKIIYFCEGDLENKNTQTVKAISLQKIDGVWKHYGRARIASKAREGSDAAKKGLSTWKDSGGIQNAIENDPKFQFDYMFRPFK